MVTPLVKTEIPLNKWWPWLLWSSLGLALIWLLANLNLGWAWVDQPFTGFLHYNLTITESNLPGWETRLPTIGKIALIEGAVIQTVDGRPPESSNQVIEYVRQKKIGWPINYTLRNPGGDTQDVTLPVILFSGQDFTQIVVVPAFITLLALLTGLVAVYRQADPLPANLFTLLGLAMVYAWVSLPEFSSGLPATLIFVMSITGRLALPPLLLHFALVFPYPRKFMLNQPVLLPLLYLPILPVLVGIPTLFNQPHTMANFYRWLDIYTFVYTAAAFALFIQAARQTHNKLVYRQTLALLIGLAVPTGLALGLSLLLEQGFNRQLIIETLQRYGLIGLPVAAMIAVIRYELFGIKQNRRLYFFYIYAIALISVGYFALVLISNLNIMRLSALRLDDLWLIIFTVAGFFLLQPLYQAVRHRVEEHFYGQIENYKISLRIFQGELLKVKSWYDLERLVSWNIPSDFKLDSAELTPGNLPSGPYAIRLPLTANNIRLGTLFFGTKIGGHDFTGAERAILTELQQPLALTVWSLELNKAIHRTEELTRLKSKFLANVTHELRTPLNSIINYIGFVVDGDTGPLNPEQKLYLEQALQGAERLLHTINNILDLSKIEAGQMSLTIQPVNLAELVAETWPHVTPLLSEKPVQIIADLSSALPTVSGDRLRLRQIILNLLTNAAKFTDAGTICLKVYPENGHVVIQVIDTGPGIQEAVLPTIFQQFNRVALTDRSEQAGAGLSLPITKSLVEMHGGQIRVESRVGQGTAFTVILPVQPMN